MKLQNNYTTPEQSKRLLELDVPIDTADCYYTSHDGDNIAVLPEGVSYSKFCKSIEKVLGERLFPCWSVGRLIEIYCLCSCVSVPYIYYNIDVTHIDIDNDTFINQIINNIKERIEENDFDLSKLEDEGL